jgi:hypothetical protein
MPKKPGCGKHLLGRRCGRLGLMGVVNLFRRAGRSRSGYLAFHGGAVRPYSGAYGAAAGKVDGSARPHSGPGRPASRRPGEVVPRSGNHQDSGPELTHSAFRPPGRPSEAGIRKMPR